jgi:hypothetical protein
MRKNLLILHLESVSNVVLWQYRLELSVIWRLMQQSLFYTRFYSSSVSTDSVLNDLFYGNSDMWDGAPLFKERRDRSNPALAKNIRPNTFHSFAFFNGYEYHNFSEHPLCNGIDNPVDFYHPDVNVVVERTKGKMRESFAKEKPFVIHFRVVVSHMAYDDVVKIRARTFSERFRLGYARQDQAIGAVLANLIDLGLLENTIIVCYGDHGDELWSHGLNKGYCHATIPYASLTNVPLFIYEHGQAPGTTDRMVSTIDLRESLIRRLEPHYMPEQQELAKVWKNRLGEESKPPYGWPHAGTLAPFRQTPFDGIDAFNETRELAFSQNLFALQLEYSDLEAGLTKGYSVTDGTYRVVVSSGGSNPKNGGMEFFHDDIDPFNIRNLLDFFKLDAKGDISAFHPPSAAISREFPLIFNGRAVEQLKNSYGKLKAALYEFVRTKENNVKDLVGDRKYHVMPESVFRHPRKRLLKADF